MSLIDWSNYFKDSSPKFPKCSQTLSHCFIRVAPCSPSSPTKMGECKCNNDKNNCREWFEERAAVIEFEGGFSRREAERLAIEELCPMMGECLKLATRYTEKY